MVYYFLIAESRRYNGRRTNSVDIGETDTMIYSIYYSQITKAYAAEVFKFFYSD